MLRESRFLLVSAGVHGGALAIVGLIALARIESRPPRVFEDLTPIEMETAPAPIELPKVAPEPVPQREPEQPPPEPGASEATRPLEPSRAAPRPNGTTEPSPNENPPPPGPARPQSEYEPLPDDNRVFTVPGIGGPAIWSMPGVMPDAPRAAPAPTVSPREREVDRDIAGRVLREAMHDSDKAKGMELPAAGNAASAVQAALYASDLPAESRGTIAVRIGPGGKVLDAKVLAMVGGTSDQWERAAQAAKTRLAAQQLNLPDAYKNGAIVYIEAVSAEQLPAGKGSGISAGGAKFDLSNLGAHRRQVVKVSTRVVPVK